MRTNTLVIISGGFGDDFSILKNNLKSGFYYLDVDPIFVNGHDNLGTSHKYNYLVYISLNGFGKDQYERIKGDYIKTLFVTDGIFTKQGMYEFFNNIHELYGVPFTNQRNVEVRIKDINYLTKVQTLQNFKDIMTQNGLPRIVSVQEVITVGKESIPITRNKDLMKELYNGEYTISNEHKSKQILINVNQESDLDGVYYLKYLKNYDVLIEFSSNLDPIYLDRIIKIINTQSGHFIKEYKTKYISSEKTVYDRVKKDSQYFSFFLIFSVMLFIYIFYKLYKENKKKHL